jgi:putative acetyltransferase
MLHLTRTDAQNPDFRALVTQLDAYLHVKDGADHAFYAQFNGLEQIKHAVVAYCQGQPVGCGAFKPVPALGPATAEIKRMFVVPEQRGRAIGGAVLAELERWAAELGYPHWVLETGTGQTEALHLYQKAGYAPMPHNYGQYAGVAGSVCLEKSLT